MDGNVVSVELVIDAPPEAIFALVADAAKHPLIDGSGSVKQVKEGAPQRLTLGSKFGMAMRIGIPYSMVSEVIEFEDNRRIAWQSRPPGIPGRFTGGRIWRYELEPVEGGTKVRESWDISQDKQRALLRRDGVAQRTKEAMEKTLAKIAEVVAEPSG